MAYKLKFISGRQLRAGRAFAGLTRAQLANLAGVHPQTVAYIERRGGKLGRRGVNAVVASLSDRGVLFFHGECVGSRAPSSTRVVIPRSLD